VLNVGRDTRSAVRSAFGIFFAPRRVRRFAGTCRISGGVDVLHFRNGQVPDRVFASCRHVPCTYRDSLLDAAISFSRACAFATR